VDSLNSNELLTRASTGLIKQLRDPYTELFAPREGEEFERGINGRYAGTDMLVAEEDDHVVTVRLKGFRCV
jgi:C-terminal processing protease CtpA/Prc